MRIKYCEAYYLGIELGAKNRTTRNVWFIGLFIADKTGDTSKILLKVRSSHPVVFFKNYVLFYKKASGMASHFNKAVSPHICNCTKKDAITGVFQFML